MNLKAHWLGTVLFVIVVLSISGCVRDPVIESTGGSSESVAVDEPETPIADPSDQTSEDTSSIDDSNLSSDGIEGSSRSSGGPADSGEVASDTDQSEAADGAAQSAIEDGDEASPAEGDQVELEIAIDHPVDGQAIPVQCDGASCWLEAAGSFTPTEGSRAYLLIGSPADTEYWVQYDSTGTDADSWRARGYLYQPKAGNEYLLKVILLDGEVPLPADLSQGMMWSDVKSELSAKVLVESEPITVSVGTVSSG